MRSRISLLSFFISLLPLLSHGQSPGDHHEMALIPDGSRLELLVDLALDPTSPLAFHKGAIVSAHTNINDDDEVVCALSVKKGRGNQMRLVPANNDDCRSFLKLKNARSAKVDRIQGGQEEGYVVDLDGSANFLTFYCYGGNNGVVTIGDVREAISKILNLEMREAMKISEEPYYYFPNGMPKIVRSARDAARDPASGEACSYDDQK